MSDEIVPPPDGSDTEPPPPKGKVSDREALVSLALEAICADDEGSLADNILDMLRDMGRDDIIRGAEQLLCEDDDEDAAPTPPVDNTDTPRELDS